MRRKEHIPAPGRSSGLRGPALCGRIARYGTGDHEMLRRRAQWEAQELKGYQGTYPDTHYCIPCLRRMP